MNKVFYSRRTIGFFFLVAFAFFLICLPFSALITGGGGLYMPLPWYACSITGEARTICNFFPEFLVIDAVIWYAIASALSKSTWGKKTNE